MLLNKLTDQNKTIGRLNVKNYELISKYSSFYYNSFHKYVFY